MHLRTMIAQLWMKPVRDYLLSPTHPVGRFKSVCSTQSVFRIETGPLCAMPCSRLRSREKSSQAGRARSGRKFEIHATCKGLQGAAASVVTVWMLPNGLDAAFVTAFCG